MPMKFGTYLIQVFCNACTELQARHGVQNDLVNSLTCLYGILYACMYMDAHKYTHTHSDVCTYIQLLHTHSSRQIHNNLQKIIRMYTNICTKLGDEMYIYVRELFINVIGQVRRNMPNIVCKATVCVCVYVCVFVWTAHHICLFIWIHQTHKDIAALQRGQPARAHIHTCHVFSQISYLGATAANLPREVLGLDSNQKYRTRVSCGIFTVLYRNMITRLFTPL